MQSLLTVSDRLIIYQCMLDQIKGTTRFWYGLCALILDNAGWFYKLDDFPELMVQKPKTGYREFDPFKRRRVTTPYWWAPGKKAKRIEVLERAIQKCIAAEKLNKRFKKKPKSGTSKAIGK